MHGEPLDPEGCLRSLTAEALLRAHPDRPLFPVSLGLQAVANAFVMLGLLPEPTAEEILAGHRLALERKGFANVGLADERTILPRTGKRFDDALGSGEGATAWTRIDVCGEGAAKSPAVPGAARLRHGCLV